MVRPILASAAEPGGASISRSGHRGDAVNMGENTDEWSGYAGRPVMPIRIVTTATAAQPTAATSASQVAS